MVLQLGSGALVATLLAFTLEMAVVLGVVTSVLGVVLVQPGGSDRIQALASNLQDAAWLEDPGNLLALLRSPWVVVPALFLFAVAVPLIEEAVKTIGVPLRAYRRPSMPQAMLWGLAGGAGFALAEGLFNSLGGMGSWAVIVSFRIGATILHCFTGAVMGLAWYHALIERRWARGIGLYAASVGIHSLWNLLVAGMAFASLGAQTGESGGLGPVAPGPGAATAFSLLAVLTLAITMAMAGLVRKVRNSNPGKVSAALQTSDAIQAPDAAGE
jgi:preprotein translocase subunit SecG